MLIILPEPDPRCPAAGASGIWSRGESSRLSTEFPMPSPSSTKEGFQPYVNPELLEGMIEKGLVDREQLENARVAAKARGIHVEEALLGTGIVTESKLLAYLARFYRTQYISTEKLSTAPISKVALKRVPRKLAERYCVFPVKLNWKKRTLLVALVHPDDADAIEGLLFATRLRKIDSLVARPAAIRAAIAKHYDEEEEAFSRIKDFGRSAPKGERWQATFDGEGPPSFFPRPDGDDSYGEFPEPDDGDSLIELPGTDGDDSFGGFPGTDGDDSFAEFEQHAGEPEEAARSFQGIPDSEPPLLSPDVVEAFFDANAEETGAGGIGFPSAPEVLSRSTAEPNRTLRPKHQPPPPTPPSSGIPLDDHLKILKALVSLLESDRGLPDGHSSLVAAMCRKVYKRLGLPAERCDDILLAAYLHDVGKSAGDHLTVLNAAPYREIRDAARSHETANPSDDSLRLMDISDFEDRNEAVRKSYLAPIRTFEGEGVPGSVVRLLTHLYERFDGTGFPDRVTGGDIEPGAQIIAMADLYAELTGHADNPFNKRFTGWEAGEIISHFAGSIFDPELVGVFLQSIPTDEAPVATRAKSAAPATLRKVKSVPPPEVKKAESVPPVEEAPKKSVPPPPSKKAESVPPKPEKSKSVAPPVAAGESVVLAHAIVAVGGDAPVKPPTEILVDTNQGSEEAAAAPPPRTMPVVTKRPPARKWPSAGEREGTPKGLFVGPSESIHEESSPLAAGERLEFDISADEGEWEIVRPSMSDPSHSRRSRRNARLALLVQPNPEDRMYLETELGEFGFYVLVADNSVDAMKLAASHKLRLIVSEVEVRPLSGFELVDKIRSRSKKPIPFAFVTRNATSRNEKRSFEMGAREFIDMSLSPGMVAVKLQRLLKGVKSGR
jgi:response regulator RpfG family c-di-GMP phosphodiesterase